MRIALVSHYFESHRGGVEIVAGQLARAFTALGHQVAWAASDTDAPPGRGVCALAQSLPVVNKLERSTGIPYPVPLPGAWAGLRRTLAGADVVLLQDGFYLTCLLARWQAKRAGLPVVLMQHIGFVPYANPLLRLAMTGLNTVLTRPALRQADQVVFISALTQTFFAGLRFRRKPELVFNGVDATVFTPAASATIRLALRQELGLPADRPVILFVGRFVEKKGLGFIAHMARLRPDWHWVLAGWGPLDPAAWRLANVTVMSGRSGPTLAPLYRMADALVLPSVGEGFPLVVQEAMACGLPVVCGEDTAQADPEAAGLLRGVRVSAGHPVGTATSFSAALAELVEGGVPEAQRVQLSTFARQRYAWTGTAMRLLDIFAELGRPTLGRT